MMVLGQGYRAGCRRSKLRLIAGAFACSVAQCGVAAHGAPAATEVSGANPSVTSLHSADAAPATIESDVHVFTVAHDGSVVERDETTLRADTVVGVDDIAQRYIWFNKDIERIDALSAESIDPRGGVHPVGPEAIRDVQAPRAAGAPMFNDGVLRTVIFPGIEPGWREHLTFRKSRAAVAPGVFEYFAVPARDPVLEQRLIFDLPADMPLYADARGYMARERVTANGRTRYEFDYRHGPRAPIEHGAVGEANDGDRLMVTTVPTYAAFAQQYRMNAVDPTANDQEVLALARALTRDAPDEWTKAARLYDWTRANIRYVALFVGETAAKPHRVVDVMRHRYGDCKDHAALYGALLAAVGIRSEPALIGLGSVYTLPSVPGYGAGAINHVIVWIPSLHRFADTTSGGGISFGFLPPSVMDRPALLVGEGILTRTPATQVRLRDARLDVEIDDSGNARYGYRVEDDGVMAERERNVFRRATRARASEMADERLRLTALRGTATVETDDVRATSGPFAVTMTGELEHVVWTDGMTAFPAWSSFAGGIASQMRDWLAEPRRTQSYVCMGGTFIERGSIMLPRDVKLVYVPSDMMIEAGPIDYAAHYVFDPASRVVQISRRLRADFGKQVCTTKDFEAMRDTLMHIERDTSSQIIVRASD
jgi:transglutaminase-like putative cysteine protease